MKIGILGTGVVGETLGTALIAKGNEVKMGSRTHNNEKAAAWVAKNGAKASQGTFKDAAIFGEMILLCLNGDNAMNALHIAEAKSFDNKIVIDVSNPLDFSKGMPPTLIASLSNTTSLAEEGQKFLSGAKIVKALNTLTAALMVNPSLVNNGDHNLFICGNDAAAKQTVSQFLADQFGWNKENIIDVGDITAARTTEAIVPFWVRLMMAKGTPMFNFKIVQ